MHSTFSFFRRLIFPSMREMLSNEDDSITTNFKIPQDWIYRGEGNCNIVLALPKMRKILRIRKTERPQSLIRWFIIWITDFLSWYCGKSIKEEIRDLKFYSTVMRPLIGRRYTSEAKSVILSRKQITYLEDKLAKYRPEFRRNKVLQYGRASLLDDFAFISQDEYEYLPFDMSQDVFAVELKPKQGWRPLNEKHLSECLYCMNQHLKLEKRQIQSISKYCPEDLFSGNEVRMKRAIQSLIETPQNNLRIFKNGELVYAENNKNNIQSLLEDFFQQSSESFDILQNEFCTLICKCLLSNLISIDLSEHCDEQLFCKWNKIIQESNTTNYRLPKGCVLEKILSVQMLDTEGSIFYSKLLNRDKEHDWDYVDMLSTILDGNRRRVCLKCIIMMLANTNNRSDCTRDLTFVPYLISAIAKDCSLMVTMKRIAEDISDDMEVQNIKKSKFGSFLINIGVFDLYPKPISTIKKHCKRNEKVMEAYLRAIRTKTK